MKGWFDPALVASGWFDPELSLPAWFTPELEIDGPISAVAAATIPPIVAAASAKVIAKPQFGGILPSQMLRKRRPQAKPAEPQPAEPLQPVRAVAAITIDAFACEATAELILFAEDELAAVLLLLTW